MTEISELGEFSLIDRLTKAFTIQNEATLVGVGDDCAVLRQREGRRTVVSCDLLLEGVHFDLTYVPLKHLGYKAAVVNFSDVCAMNAHPKQLIVAIGLSRRFKVEHIEEFYAGIQLACQAYGVDLVGGDTTASMTGLTISATCIGEVADEKTLAYRSGAKATDLVCVSGNLGAAYMGLQLLEREKAVFSGLQTESFAPDFESHEYLLQRQLRPEARLDIVNALAEKSIIPTSMIDLSDGLSSELLHIAKQSEVGVRIYEDRIPIDYQTAVMAEEFNLNVTTAALNGGEDYELLFTAPLALHDIVSQLDDVRIIGHITESKLGSCLVARDGTEISLTAQGWTSLSDSQ